MKTIFEKDLSGEIVSPNEPGYEALITDIFATIRTATEMNTSYHTPEEVHEYMGRILGKPLEESTTVLPPYHSFARSTSTTVSLSRSGRDVSSSSVVLSSDAAASRLAMMYSLVRRST